MKTFRSFLSIFFSFVFSLMAFAEESNIVIQNMTSSQDSLYGTVFQGSFSIPTEIDSLAKIKFAEMNLLSTVSLPDSNALYYTELIALNTDGSVNENYISTNILTLARNGKTYFDITRLVKYWNNGSVPNAGFIIRRKHSDPNEANASFIGLPTGGIANVKIIYSH